MYFYTKKIYSFRQYINYGVILRDYEKQCVKDSWLLLHSYVKI